MLKFSNFMSVSGGDQKMGKIIKFSSYNAAIDAKIIEFASHLKDSSLDEPTDEFLSALNDVVNGNDPVNVTCDVLTEACEHIIDLQGRLIEKIVTDRG